MADKEISGLPPTTAVRSDTLIPVYQPGDVDPAQKMTGEQFSAFAKSEVRESVLKSETAAMKALESARNASMHAQTARDASDAVQNALDNIPAGGTLVINDLTTGGAAAALSAEMGKVLNESKVPVSGGTMTGPLENCVDSVGAGRFIGNMYGAYLESYAKDSASIRQLFLGNSAQYSDVKNALMLTAEDGGSYKLYGEHNKRGGAYNGNSSTEVRFFDLGLKNDAGDGRHVGDVVSITTTNDGGCWALVGYQGALLIHTTTGTFGTIPASEIHYRDGNLVIGSTNMFVNQAGYTYFYQLL